MSNIYSTKGSRKSILINQVTWKNKLNNSLNNCLNCQNKSQLIFFTVFTVLLYLLLLSWKKCFEIITDFLLKLFHFGDNYSLIILFTCILRVNFRWKKSEEIFQKTFASIENQYSIPGYYILVFWTTIYCFMNTFCFRGRRKTSSLQWFSGVLCVRRIRKSFPQ